MTDVTTIGLVVGIVMAIIEILKTGMTKFFDYLNGTTSKSDKDAHQQTEIAVLEQRICTLQEVNKQIGEKLNKIETNDLAHINAKLDLNLTEHRDLFVELGEIKQILKSK
ncbi:hypothetical protein M0R04_13280 [Candidatus Dojkabacteria bacterium]|jgi:hypothetical protein|nr:hypothetical protein [Candidatus Dojkabacteria bacterium]